MQLALAVAPARLLGFRCINKCQAHPLFLPMVVTNLQRVAIADAQYLALVLLQIVLGIVLDLRGFVATLLRAVYRGLGFATRGLR